MQFEWDETKADQNYAKHGVDFVLGARILLDPRKVTLPTYPGNDPERWLALGEYEGRIYVVVYTARGDKYRIISVRVANHDEARNYANL